MRALFIRLVAPLVTSLGACYGNPAAHVDGGSDAPPSEDALDGQPPSGDGPLPCGQLRAVMRDFSYEHIDFERDPGLGPGIVEPLIGADRKPVYAHTGAYHTVTSPESFAQWYNDVPGVNERFEIVLPLTADGDLFVFEDNSFFPRRHGPWRPMQLPHLRRAQLSLHHGDPRDV